MLLIHICTTLITFIIFALYIIDINKIIKEHNVSMRIPFNMIVLNILIVYIMQSFVVLLIIVKMNK